MKQDIMPTASRGKIKKKREGAKFFLTMQRGVIQKKTDKLCLSV